VFYSAISNATGSSRGVGRQNNVAVPLTSSPYQVSLASLTSPLSATLTLNGMTLGRNELVETGFFGPQGIGFLGYSQFTASGTSTTRTIQGIPQSLLQNGDLHLLYAAEQGSAGDRWYYGYSATFGDRTSMLWPQISGITRSCGSSGGAPVRVRTQGTVPSQYTGQVVIEHHQTLAGGGFRSLFGNGTYEYTNGVSIDWTSPTFQGGNYNGALWGLQPSTPITGAITVYGSNIAGGSLYGAPVDGLKVYGTDMELANLTCP
jgi:hypothetical protein